MPIQIIGAEAVLRAWGKKRADDGKAIAEVLEAAAGVLLRKSKQLVPKKTRALEKSGKVEVEGKGLGATASVVYGGPEAPYAFIVHERLDVRHEPPTQARYLADAVPMVRGTITSMVKRQVEVKIKGNT